MLIHISSVIVRVRVIPSTIGCMGIKRPVDIAVVIFASVRSGDCPEVLSLSTRGSEGELFFTLDCGDDSQAIRCCVVWIPLFSLCLRLIVCPLMVCHLF